MFRKVVECCFGPVCTAEGLMFAVAIGSEPSENTGAGIFSARKRDVADLQVNCQCLELSLIIFLNN